MDKPSLYEQMKKAGEKINQALVESGLITIPVKHSQRSIYSSDQYQDKLTDESIKVGVISFAAVNNMQGGSIADIWLYDLLKVYLKEPEKRKAINQIIFHGANI